MKLSAVVITFNEEKNIRRCLESLTFADEIVVLDSGSADKTVEIAKRYGAQVFTRKFDNFSSQRNHGATLAKNNWILSMDADEVIPSSLADEITSVLHNPEFDGYLMPRRNIIFGKEIKHTRWSPDKHVWLYDKTKGHWEGELHEEVKVKGGAGELKNAKIHYSHESVSDFIKMLNSYTDKEADLKVKKGVRFSFVNMFYDALKSFIGRFIYKLGFLDGKEGFVLSCLMAFYRLVTWMKIWEKQN